MLGGYSRLKFVVDWFMSQRGSLIVDYITREELVECLVVSLTKYEGKKDYSVEERRVHYEDFLEFLARIVSSIYWVHGVSDKTDAKNKEGDEEVKDGNASVAPNENTGAGDINNLQQDSSILSLASSELGAIDMCARLELWLQSLNSTSV